MSSYRFTCLLVVISIISSVFLISCSQEDTAKYWGCNCGDNDIQYFGGDSEFDIEKETADGDVDSEQALEIEEETTPKIHPADCIIDPDCKEIMVTAHRGSHVSVPENSLASIRAAAKIGCEFAEIDVRDTKDEKLVLMHDAEADRTTDGQGDVSEMTLEQIRALKLNGYDDNDPETVQVPQFSEALALAKELSIMLYVDMKTSRGDLVLQDIQAGDYYREALVRDNYGTLAPMIAEDDKLLIMPPIDNEEEFNTIKEQAGELLHIVEIGKLSPEKELCDKLKQAGVKAQQDIMVLGDGKAMMGDYTGWIQFIEAGVFLLQSDLPHLLVPALDEYRETGVFPTEGPGEEL